MALTKEDLKAIKDMLDPRFDRIDERFDRLEEDVSVLKEDVSGLKEDVSGLKESVSSLKENVDSLNSDMKEVKERLTKIEVVQLENYLIPKVEEIAAYQKSVYERYTKDADRFEEKISLIDSIDAVVKDHSEQIKELQLKQA